MADLSAFANLFDRQLSDLAELPAYTPPPTGAYSLLVSVKPKIINEKPAVEASFKVLACLEQADAAEVPAKDGQEFSVLYTLLDKTGKPNEFGEGKLREFLMPFAAQLGDNNMMTLVSGKIDNMTINAIVKRKVDKNDADRFNVDIKDITFA